MKRYSPLYQLASILILSTTLGLSASVFAGSDPTYSPQARALMNSAQDLFIQAGLCKEKQKDCSARELILGKGTRTGIYIEVYEIDTALVGEVLRLALLSYEQNGRRISVRVEAYSEPHKARLGKVLNGPKPYMVLELKQND